MVQESHAGSTNPLDALTAPLDQHSKEAVDRLLLDLFMATFQGIGERKGRMTSRGGTGLVGHVYSPGSEASREQFRRELAELMIEYHVDKVDVSWSVPHVLRAFRPSTPQGAPTAPTPRT